MCRFQVPLIGLPSTITFIPLASLGSLPLVLYVCNYYYHHRCIYYYHHCYYYYGRSRIKSLSNPCHCNCLCLMYSKPIFWLVWYDSYENVLMLRNNPWPKVPLNIRNIKLKTSQILYSVYTKIIETQQLKNTIIIWINLTNEINQASLAWWIIITKVIPAKVSQRCRPIGLITYM